MQGDNRVIKLLNGVLTCELTSINLFLARKDFQNWGLETLNERNTKNLFGI